MVLRILIPIVVVVLGMALFYSWYRKKIADMAPDEETRALPGARLTSERLRLLSNPPWRVVFEIGGTTLGDIDHVVIGPTGVIAIETIMADRPVAVSPDAPGQRSPAELMASAAIARGDVDDITRRVGIACDTLVKVYWGTPDADEPAGIDITEGLVAVEGQRLEQWLMDRPPGPLATAQVDQVWQAVLTGIGRPDPLA